MCTPVECTDDEVRNPWDGLCYLKSPCPMAWADLCESENDWGEWDSGCVTAPSDLVWEGGDPDLWLVGCINCVESVEIDGVEYGVGQSAVYECVTELDLIDCPEDHHVSPRCV